MYRGADSVNRMRPVSHLHVHPADPAMTAEKSKQAVALAKRALGLDLDVHFSFTSLDVVLTAVLEKLAMQDEMLAELTDGARPARSDSASPLPATGGGGGGRIYALYDDLKGEVDELRTRLDASESKNSLLESKLDEALHTADALESLRADVNLMRTRLDGFVGWEEHGKVRTHVAELHTRVDLLDELKDGFMANERAFNELREDFRALNADGLSRRLDETMSQVDAMSEVVKTMQEELQRIVSASDSRMLTLGNIGGNSSAFADLVRRLENAERDLAQMDDDRKRAKASAAQLAELERLVQGINDRGGSGSFRTKLMQEDLLKVQAEVESLRKTKADSSAFDELLALRESDFATTSYCDEQVSNLRALLDEQAAAVRADEGEMRNMRELLRKMRKMLGAKADRDDMETRFNMDNSATLRKQLVPPLNCLACDRAIDEGETAAFPSIPVTSALPQSFDSSFYARLAMKRSAVKSSHAKASPPSSPSAIINVSSVANGGPTKEQRASNYAMTPSPPAARPKTAV